MACFQLGAIAEESLILQALKPSEADGSKILFNRALTWVFLPLSSQRELSCMRPV
jgi:hypothetical protein